MESEDRSEFFANLVWDGNVPPPSEIPSECGSEAVLKMCTRCKDPQLLENFHKDCTRKDGVNNWCKTCMKSYDTKRRRVEPDDTHETSEQVQDVEPCRDTGADSLYIMSNSWRPDMVKIGRSSNPEERAKQMNASHPFRLAIEHSYGGKGFLEKPLHDRLKHRRVEGGPGREWFKLSAEQADTLIRASIVDHELAGN